MMHDEFTDEDENFDPSTLPPIYVRKLNGFLRAACKQGQLTCVDLLVERGADVDVIDREDGSTVLQAAIMHGHTKVVEYLIHKVSNKTLKSAHAYTVQRYTQLEDTLKLFHKKDSSLAAPASSVLSSVAVHSNSQEKKSANETRKIEADTADLSQQIKDLQISSEGFHKQLESFQKERSDLNAQIARLTSELKTERDQRQEVLGHFEDLHKELADKEDEITSIKTERDNERRAKENAKRILSLDNMNIPTVVTPNPLFNMSDKPRMPRGSKSIVDLTAFDIQGRGNRMHTTAQDLIPNKQKMEGSKDDLEIHMTENSKVKDRVRKLVRTWEEMTFEQPAKLSQSSSTHL